MAGTIDYDALINGIRSEKAPQDWMGLWRGVANERKIQELLEQARAQQQFTNEQEAAKNKALIDYHNAQTEATLRDKTERYGTQKANLMKEQALEQARQASGILSGIRSSYDLPGMDSGPALHEFLNNPSVPEAAKKFLRPDNKTYNFTKDAIDAALGHLGGYDPLQMKQLGIQTKEAGSNLRNENTLMSQELRKQWELEQKDRDAAAKAEKASVAKSAQEQYNKSIDAWRASPTPENESKVLADYEILKATWLARITNNPDLAGLDIQTIGGIPKLPPGFKPVQKPEATSKKLPEGWKIK